MATSSASSSSAAVHSTTSHFRRLAWQASITVRIRLAHPSVATSDLNTYYLQVPRYTYLALLVPELRDNFVNVLLSVQDRADLREGDWWFEHEPDAAPGDDSVAPVASALGPCRWHWPLDQHHLYAQLHRPHPASTSSYFQQATPAIQSATLDLVLHLSNPPQTNSQPDIESAKASFVAQLKEADFVRWGNTRRVTNLRRADLEAAWDGVLADDFDLHSRFTSKILPLPLPVPTAGAGTDGNKPESVYSCRALPVKLYLPDDAPVIQEVIAPLGADGQPTTVSQLLRTHLPLLFPQSPNPYALAVPIMQGVTLPPESVVAWLTSCMSGADGWLRIGIQLVADQ